MVQSCVANRDDTDALIEKIKNNHRKLFDRHRHKCRNWGAIPALCHVSIIHFNDLD